MNIVSVIWVGVFCWVLRQHAGGDQFVNPFFLSFFCWKFHGHHSVVPPATFYEPACQVTSVEAVEDEELIDLNQKEANALEDRLKSAGIPWEP